MQDNYDAYAQQRAIIQNELNHLPRCQINGKTFEKTHDERHFMQKLKTEWEVGMQGFLGPKWKEISRVLGVCNVPTDMGVKLDYQKRAKQKGLLN